MARSNSDPAVRRNLFQHALDEGIRAFDTAPLYDFGETETLLGEVLSGADPDVRVFGKVGLSWRPDSRGPVHFETKDAGGRPRIVYRDSRPESVRQDVEETLQRLSRPSLELVQVHFRDTQTPIPETMAALAELKQEGKVGAIGVSNFTLAEIQEAANALAPMPLAAVQIRLNLLQHRPLADREIVSWCRERGIAVLAYSPLAEGRLARLTGTGNRAVDSAVGELGRMAAEAGLPMSALALAWLIRQPGVSAAIVGASNVDQLHDALSAETVPDELIQRLTERFRGIDLPDAWEGPAWKRKLRSLMRRFQ